MDMAEHGSVSRSHDQDIDGGEDRTISKEEDFSVKDAEASEVTVSVKRSREKSKAVSLLRALLIPVSVIQYYCVPFNWGHFRVWLSILWLCSSTNLSATRSCSGCLSTSRQLVSWNGMTRRSVNSLPPSLPPPPSLSLDANLSAKQSDWLAILFDVGSLLGQSCYSKAF